MHSLRCEHRFGKAVVCGCSGLMQSIQPSLYGTKLNVSELRFIGLLRHEQSRKTSAPTMQILYSCHSHY